MAFFYTCHIAKLFLLQDSWPSLGQVPDDARNEVIGRVIQACQEGGSLASILCSQVWPRIGQLDERVLHTVIDRFVPSFSSGLERIS